MFGSDRSGRPIVSFAHKQQCTQSTHTTFSLLCFVFWKKNEIALHEFTLLTANATNNAEDLKRGKAKKCTNIQNWRIHNYKLRNSKIISFPTIKIFSDITPQLLAAPCPAYSSFKINSGSTTDLRFLNIPPELPGVQQESKYSQQIDCQKTQPFSQQRGF